MTRDRSRHIQYRRTMEVSHSRWQRARACNYSVVTLNHVELNRAAAVRCHDGLNEGATRCHSVVMKTYMLKPTMTSSTLTRTCVGHKPAPVAVPVSYTHLRAHETVLDLVCRLLL